MIVLPEKKWNKILLKQWHLKAHLYEVDASLPSPMTIGPQWKGGLEPWNFLNIPKVGSLSDIYFYFII